MRSAATHAITFECTKLRRGPRTSHSPSSGSRQCASTQSITRHSMVQPAGTGVMPSPRARNIASTTSPYTSSCR